MFLIQVVWCLLKSTDLDESYWKVTVNKEYFNISAYNSASIQQNKVYKCSY